MSSYFLIVFYYHLVVTIASAKWKGKNLFLRILIICQDVLLGLVKRIWYLLPMRAAKVQASLCIRAVSPEPPLLTHTNSELIGTFRQKARSLAPLNGWACAVKICHDGMLEDTNLLDASQLSLFNLKAYTSHCRIFKNTTGTYKFYNLQFWAQLFKASLA